MSVYLIYTREEIHDEVEFNKYRAGFGEIFSKYKGEIVAGELKPRVLEGKWSYDQTIIVKFPNETEADNWYQSPEYQKLLQHRLRSSTGNSILLAGRD